MASDDDPHLRRFLACRDAGDEAGARAAWEALLTAEWPRLKGFVELSNVLYDRTEREEALELAALKLWKDMITTFRGRTKGEWVNAVRTCVWYAAHQVQRDAAKRREREAVGIDEDDAAGWRREKFAREQEKAAATDFVAWALPQIARRAPAPRPAAVARGRHHGGPDGRARHEQRQHLQAAPTRPGGPGEAQGAVGRMSTIDRLFSDFVDAWNRGEDPSVQDGARPGRARRARRAARAALRSGSRSRRRPRCSRRRPRPWRTTRSLRAALEATGREAGAWPELLPRLRDRAGLSVRAVAERLVGVFGLRGQEERAVARLEEMERGELDATRVSRRLLDALGTVLGVPGEELAEAGTLRFRPAAAPSALFRADGEPTPGARRGLRRARRGRGRAGAAADGRARPALPRRP